MFRELFLQLFSSEYMNIELLPHNQGTHILCFIHNNQKTTTTTTLTTIW